jgi:predicted deacetylase
MKLSIGAIVRRANYVSDRAWHTVPVMLRAFRAARSLSLVRYAAKVTHARSLSFVMSLARDYLPQWVTAQ